MNQIKETEPIESIKVNFGIANGFLFIPLVQGFGGTCALMSSAVLAREWNGRVLDGDWGWGMWIQGCMCSVQLR